MTNKEQFLVNNVGFHKEDLSLKKRLELNKTIRAIGKGNDWLLAALSFHTLEEWERFGFGLMKKKDFQEEVDLLLEDINEITEEEFEKENQRGRIIINEEDFRARWNAVKAQGKVLSAEEAKEKELKNYIGYTPGFENSKLIDEWVEQCDELPMELWTTFYLSTQRVMVIKGGVW